MLEWIVDARDASHPVADQGRRGTCLAMAITGAHEHAMGAPLLGNYLSAEYLHWASGGYPGGRGRPTAATSALDRDGQPAVQQWPYIESTDDSSSGYGPPPDVVGPFARRSSSHAVFDLDDAVVALKDGRWPVLGIRVTDAFAARGAGIVLPDGIGRAGHAVLIVGVAEVRGDKLAPHVTNGERLVCVRNSWGAGWGKDGHKLVTETALAAVHICSFTLL